MRFALADNLSSLSIPNTPADKNGSDTSDDALGLEQASTFREQLELFKKESIDRKTVPSSTTGVEIELPNFEALFQEISSTSILASKVLLQGNDTDEVSSSFQEQKEQFFHNLEKQWIEVETFEETNAVKGIAKIENYRNNGCPLVRFRSTVEGLPNVQTFADLIMQYDHRIKWDDTAVISEEVFPAKDLHFVNQLIENENYGTCVRLGIGYYRSKGNALISAREQLSLCGIQEFKDGSAIIWATECPSWHDNLLPPGEERCVRAKAHIIFVVLTPVKKDGDGSISTTYDIEYIYQIDVGGLIPTFLTTPLMIDTTKKLFDYAVSGRADATQ